MILFLRFLFIFKIISPFKSVLKIFEFIFFNLSNTSLFGCPNLLLFPTPINAILGATSRINSSELDVFEP